MAPMAAGFDPAAGHASVVVRDPVSPVMMPVMARMMGMVMAVMGMTTMPQRRVLNRRRGIRAGRYRCNRRGNGRLRRNGKREDQKDGKGNRKMTHRKLRDAEMIIYWTDLPRPRHQRSNPLERRSPSRPSRVPA